MDKARKTEKQRSKAALGELPVPQNTAGSAFLPLNQISVNLAKLRHHKEIPLKSYLCCQILHKARA